MIGLIEKKVIIQTERIYYIKAGIGKSIALSTRFSKLITDICLEVLKAEVNRRWGP